jgi:hypothetical protein
MKGPAGLRDLKGLLLLFKLTAYAQATRDVLGQGLLGILNLGDALSAEGSNRFRLHQIAINESLLRRLAIEQVQNGLGCAGTPEESGHDRRALPTPPCGRTG